MNEIVYFLDDRYWLPVLVSAKSAMLHYDGNCSEKLRFTLVCCTVQESHKEYIVKELKSARTEIRFVEFEQDLFKDYPAWHGSKMVWARCRLDLLLADTDDWVCICDGDTLWLKDPAELYAFARRQPAAIVVCGSSDYVSDADRCNEGLLKCCIDVPASQYFCMGFALIHLGRMRTFKVYERSVDFLNKFGVPDWYEQDIFNYIFRGNKVLLPLGWGASAIRGVSKCPLDEIGCIHYYGSTPWPASFFRRMTDVHVPWWHLCYHLMKIKVEERRFSMSRFKWLVMRLQNYLYAHFKLVRELRPNSVSSARIDLGCLVEKFDRLWEDSKGIRRGPTLRRCCT